ncbi:MAG: type 4a pilus biogenesis protein PilO [Candidatus Omnitrophota bacterium]
MIIRDLTRREKVFFVICLLMAVLYFLYYLLYRPLNQWKAALRNDVEAKERAIVKDLRILERGKYYHKESEDILQRFKQKDSEEKTMSAILSEIEQVAGETDLSIAEMKPQRVKKDGLYNNFSVSLSLDGSLRQVIHFLYVLQGDAHLFSVDDVRLDKISPRLPTLKCRLVISKTLIP